MIETPRSSASCDVSTMVTGMPAERKFIEMPPPMVPAPITPTRWIGFVATSGPMSAILAAARSAKNTCRCAFDWVEPSSAMNISRSFARPSSNGRSTAFLTERIAFSHASKPRNLRAFALRIASKIVGLAARRRQLLVAVADLFQGRLVGDQPPGEGDRALPELAFLGQRIDHAPILRVAGAERGAGQNDVERRLDPDEARQALRAAGAGDEAELDLRQAAFGRGDGDPVMRGQRDLEAAAERRAVQGGDHRLLGVLYPVEHVGKKRRRVRLAEFGDVGAGDEGAAGADQDRRLDLRVGLGLFDAELETLADGLGEGVDRGRVDRDDRDVALDRIIRNRIDGCHRHSSRKVHT